MSEVYIPTPHSALFFGYDVYILGREKNWENLEKSDSAALKSAEAKLVQCITIFTRLHSTICSYYFI